MEIKRLHLASLQSVDGRRWPVHGFVVTHDGDAVLVDTGVGGPQQALDDWRVVNRSVADALAELDLSPADIGLVINTHLHFDHCGQNAVFKHAPFYVQRAEHGPSDRRTGDPASPPRVYPDPASDKLPPGQASDLPAWRDSLRRVQALG